MNTASNRERKEERHKDNRISTDHITFLEVYKHPACQNTAHMEPFHVASQALNPLNPEQEVIHVQTLATLSSDT